MTTVKHSYIIAGLVALILFGAIVLHAYISSGEAVAAQRQLREDVAAQIKAGQQELRDALAQIARDRNEVKTPQQIVQRLPQYIPLPKPIILVGPQPDNSAGKLPDAPGMQLGGTAQGSLVIPAESVSAFWTHETQCKEDSLKLAECQKELPLLTKRAEAAEKAMRGGSFWSKVKNNTKYLVLGGAAATLAVCATGHCQF